MCSFKDIVLVKVLSAIDFYHINISAWFLTYFPSTDNGVDYPNNFLLYFSEYYTTLVSSKDDSKGVWQALNAILHREKVSILPDVPAEILSDQFADYFIEKINKIRSVFPDQPDTDQSSLFNFPLTFSAFSPVDEAFVYRKDLNKANMRNMSDCIVTCFMTFIEVNILNM